MTARDVERGQDAVKKLKELGFNPLFHQLDINDQKSVDTLKDFLVKEHGGLDLLVNNAAIAFPVSTKTFFLISNICMLKFLEANLCFALFVYVANVFMF